MASRTGLKYYYMLVVIRITCRLVLLLLAIVIYWQLRLYLLNVLSGSVIISCRRTLCPKLSETQKGKACIYSIVARYLLPASIL
uniref:Uncharacterized protein n=1 Tax=Arundo donax TaxID=35708 RepID=A0A0A9DFM9_ARUDO